MARGGSKFNPRQPAIHSRNEHMNVAAASLRLSHFDKESSAAIDEHGSKIESRRDAAHSASALSKALGVRAEYQIISKQLIALLAKTAP